MRNGDFSSHGDTTLELALLALILRDNSVLDQLSGLDPEDLSDPQYQVALATALSLREQNRAINPVTMRSLLGFSGETAAYDIVGAAQAFSVDGTLSPVADVVASLRGLAVRRRLDKLGSRIKVLAADPAVSPSDAIADMMKEGDAILADARPQGKTLYTLSDAADTFLISLWGETSRTYIRTGYSKLDGVIGGLPRAEMTILGGQTSMGKTALAVAVASEVASIGSNGVVYFSQEMPNDSFMARVASMYYWKPNERQLPYTNIKPGRVPQEHHEELVRSTIAGAEKAGMMEYRRGLTLSEVSSTIRIARQTMAALGRSLDLVVVDHIGLMQAPQRKNNSRANEISEISDGLCRIAKSEDVALLALSQLNREVGKQQDDQRPSLHHLRDSGSLEQDASVVMFVYRDAYKFERKMLAGVQLGISAQADWIATRNKLEINIAKNRNGALGTVELFVDLPNNIVRDQ
jgi:replicative DNA helicase